MRQTAHLLSCAAGAIWLSASGFVGPPGQARAQAAPQKMAGMPAQPRAAQEDLLVQQFEQQFAPQFRSLYRTELHFLRLVCQPTKQQYEKIAADGETVVKATIRTFALGMHGLARGGQSAGQSSDPRQPIADALAKSVRKTLAPEQAARYEKELEQRTAARKRTVLLNLVAKVDKLLVLTPEQRDKLRAVLERKWNDSWCELQLLMYGNQYFPQMPDTEILPLLTETQKVVWRGIQKGNIHFGFNPGFVQGIVIEDEVWDDDRPPEKPDRADGKANPKGKGTTKLGEKK